LLYKIKSKAEKSASLAPPYDILCTELYNLDKKMAMNIGGQNDPQLLFARHWERMAESVDLKPKYVLQTLAGVAKTIKDNFSTVEKNA